MLRFHLDSDRRRLIIGMTARFLKAQDSRQTAILRTTLCGAQLCWGPNPEVLGLTLDPGDDQVLPLEAMASQHG